MSILFIVSEVFGSGRHSVVDPVRKVLDRLDLAIPCTTRTSTTADNPDGGFAFTSTPLESFELMIARGELLEHVKILGNYYGTPHKFLQQARDNGNDLLVQADHRGVEQIKKRVPDAVSILILPAQPARAEDIVSSAVSPRSASLFREVLLPSIQEVFSQRQVPNRDKYDHVIVYDRPEDGASGLIEIIRTERLRRQRAQGRSIARRTPE